jgi:hypothetical protein
MTAERIENAKSRIRKMTARITAGTKEKNTSNNNTKNRIM